MVDCLQNSLFSHRNIVVQNFLCNELKIKVVCTKTVSISVTFKRQIEVKRQEEVGGFQEEITTIEQCEKEITEQK